MKLGEALSRRADLQARIHQLVTRLPASAVVQEGDEPPEDPQALLTELDAMTAELQRLIAAVNQTNATTRLPDGRTLTTALAEREVLALRQSVLRAASDQIAAGRARYSRSELRLVRHVDVGALRKEVDDLARRRRELDTAIQEANWTTDLAES
jgi:hypothetical protein